jgi:opacity protein-like surface antigen
MKKIILAAILLISFGFAVFAQDDTETVKNEFTVWGGFSPDSSTLFKGVGRTPDARFGIIAVRYARRFNNNDKVNLKFTADVVPFAALSYPDVEIASAAPLTLRNVRPTRTAFGLAPLGLQINFRPRRKLQPFVGASGGFLYFNERTPNFVGTRFNFTADVGGGIEYRLKNKRAITFGYKYYHISNGDRGRENPGIDNNLFYIGYTFFSK